MLKMIISINNNEEAVVLPSIPPDFGLSREKHNDTYSGLTRDYNILGTMGLWNFNLSSTFPVGRRYPYMPAEALTDGWRYVSFFERNIPRKIPFRVVLLDSAGKCRLNSPCSIDSFEWQIKRNGDIAYTLTAREYRFMGGGC